MSTAEITEHPPIYGRLIEERGDAPAEAREAAQQVQRQAAVDLDWSDVRLSQQKKEAHGFSAFG
ncbi:hypothetical protein [Streptomyces sp. SPB162]|uniref:hypothetical protein n=1 Tax=Streptomyces sp. SPB162 TaxID=2940560 RepID=UPI002407739F|nr:hypothetical protein [Streptomyces sp. SPB162]MDF9810785.1 hypothetical protein [Streptomyces sp. SPB162]